MKTEDLISMLATGETAVTARRAERNFTIATGWGMAGAMLLMLLLLRIRHDLLQAVMLPMFWVKIGFVAWLAGGSLYAVLCLSRPGSKLTKVPLAIALPIVSIWLIAIFSLFGADSLDRSKLFFGETWKTCPLLIAMLSVPTFVAVMLAMKGQAPTQPLLAGFVAGLLSGAVAAVVYCLHCPEMGAPFIGFWYLLGILIPASVGAALGESLFRW
jgi:hypothetical protein